MSKKKTEQEHIYEFWCEACGDVFEWWLTMSQKRPKRCPSCKKNKLCQSFSTNVICNFLESAKTFGKAAEINAKRVGASNLKEIESADPLFQHREEQKKNVPWWRKGKIEGLKKMDKPLDVTKIKDKQKYIMTGETS